MKQMIRYARNIGKGKIERKLIAQKNLNSDNKIPIITSDNFLPTLASSILTYFTFLSGMNYQKKNYAVVYSTVKG